MWAMVEEDGGTTQIREPCWARKNVQNGSLIQIHLLLSETIPCCSVFKESILWGQCSKLPYILTIEAFWSARGNKRSGSHSFNPCGVWIDWLWSSYTDYTAHNLSFYESTNNCHEETLQLLEDESGVVVGTSWKLLVANWNYSHWWPHITETPGEAWRENRMGGKGHEIS